MKLRGQIVSAILLAAVFAPSVSADLITDPKEFNLLKRLTGASKKNGNNEKKGFVLPKPKDDKKTSTETTTDKLSDKSGQQADDKIGGDGRKPSVRAKSGESIAKPAAPVSSEKSK